MLRVRKLVRVPLRLPRGDILNFLHSFLHRCLSVRKHHDTSLALRVLAHEVRCTIALEEQRLLAKVRVVL